jgi:hypothetical protein
MIVNITLFVSGAAIGACAAFILMALIERKRNWPISNPYLGKGAAAGPYRPLAEDPEPTELDQ